MKDGVRYRKQFNTSEEATAWESNLRLAISRGDLIDKEEKSYKPLSLMELFDRVINRHWKDTPNEATARNHCYQIENFFGPKTLIKNITTEKLDKFVLHCKDKGNSPATIRLKLASMSKAFTFAGERNLIDKKPVFPRIKVNNERMVYFSEDEEIEIPRELRDGELSDSDMIDLSAGEDLEAIRAKLVPKKSSIPLEMLDQSQSNDDKVAVLRMIVAEEPAKVAGLFRKMITPDNNK